MHKNNSFWKTYFLIAFIVVFINYTPVVESPLMIFQKEI